MQPPSFIPEEQTVGKFLQPDPKCFQNQDDGVWRIIGPTEPGPQRFNTGGEMAMWISSDKGKNWKLKKVSVTILMPEDPSMHMLFWFPIDNTLM